MNTPAAAGGKPVRESFLPFALPMIDQDDIRSVTETLKGDVLSMGSAVSRFEEAFASYTGSKYAVAVSSGAAGLHIALMAGGIGPQEEVIAPPLTHPASTNCILYQKAVPIFTDVSPSTMTLDPDQVQARLTERTRAMIITHYGGFPCQLDRLMEIARKRDLLVIEDATRSLGALYRGKMTGRYGHMGVFSFSGTQGVTTGEGGMVVTDDGETARWLAMFRDGGMVRDRERLTKYPGPWHREMQDLGYNYRMTEMQAALGLSQLKKAGLFLKRRAEIAGKYTRAFQQLEQLVTPQPVDGAEPSWDLYPLRLRPGTLAGRREVFEAIQKENIGLDVMYLPVHLQPYYLWIGHPDVCTITDSLCPAAEEIYENLICLPIYPAMTDRDVEDVITAVCRVISHFARQ
ncbi:MAG: DegT/DnrJ/EryC1/StrS family aminotransferase [Peptococcaceae bacterium]|nr:DegT/DnrJ/EryC1/StrS family aminotransferase [Peptococcaceae bacterium]